MKKIYFLALSSLVAAVSFGQQRMHSTAQPVNQVPSTYNWPVVQSVPTDTLWGIFPLGSNIATGTATPTYYTTNGGGVGGFVGGNNGYGDLDKAQAFVVTSPYTVEGCIFLFGAKRYGSGSPTSKVVAHLYDMTGTATLSTGAGAGPGAVIASTNVDITIASIDTSMAGAAGFVFVTFPTPYNATADYAAGIDLTTIAATDSVGLASSTDPESGMIDQSFDNWSAGGGWHSFLEANNWGLNVDLAIFPIINDPTGVSELFFINGIKLYQNYPNPLKENTTINFELEKEAKHVRFFVHDVNGKQVKKIDFGNLSSGKHTVSLDANQVAQGTYFFMLQADHNRIAKKMTIAK